MCNNTAPDTEPREEEMIAAVKRTARAPYAKVDGVSDSHRASHRSVRISMHAPGDANRHNSARINFEIVEELSTGASEDDATSIAIDDAQEKEPFKPRPVHERADFKYLIMGGVYLMMCAGFINACALAERNELVTHVTGRTTRTGSQVAHGEWTEAGNNALILLAFVTGAMVSGIGVGTEKFVMGQKYGWFLMAIGGLYMGSGFIMRYATEWWWGVALASFAAGMQNSLCTSFSGGVVRTTHVTGMLTDIGVCSGHWIRSCFVDVGDDLPKPDKWKLRVLLPQYTGFIFAGMLGTWAHDEISTSALYIGAGQMMLFGLVYSICSLLGLFDNFLEDERREHEMEKVEEQFHAALQEAVDRGAKMPRSLSGTHLTPSHRTISRASSTRSHDRHSHAIRGE